MGKSAQLYQEWLESLDPAELLKLQMTTCHGPPEMYEHEHPRSHEDWNKIFGACTELCYQVLKEQDGTSVPAKTLFDKAVSFAFEVILNDRPITISEAYIQMGYPNTTGEYVPF